MREHASHPVSWTWSPSFLPFQNAMFDELLPNFDRSNLTLSVNFPPTCRRLFMFVTDYSGTWIGMYDNNLKPNIYPCYSSASSQSLSPQQERTEFRLLAGEELPSAIQSNKDKQIFLRNIHFSLFFIFLRVGKK